MPNDRLVVPFYKFNLPYVHRWEEKLRGEGIAILQEAKIPGLLQKFVEEIIKPQHPDVQIDPEEYHLVSTHGVVSKSVKADFRDEVLPGTPSQRTYKLLTVGARILTREITVTTRDGYLLLTESQWCSPDVVYETLQQAWKTPLRWI